MAFATFSLCVRLRACRKKKHQALAGFLETGAFKREKRANEAIKSSC